MTIKLQPDETRAAIAAYVQAKTGIEVSLPQVCIWFDPNDPDAAANPSFDSLDGIGIKVEVVIKQ